MQALWAFSLTTPSVNIRHFRVGRRTSKSLGSSFPCRFEVRPSDQEPAGLIPIGREAEPTQIEIKRVRFEASACLAETPGQGHYLHSLEPYRQRSNRGLG